MTGRKRRVVGDRDECLRLGVIDGRPVTIDQGLDSHRRPVGERDRDHCEPHRSPAPVERAEDEREPDPEEAEAPGVREPFEDRIEPTRAMVDDPALEMAIGRDQAGTICFVCSISARKSKGLPTNP